MTATGALLALPPGPERDELLGLVRIGAAFRSQHRGRRPGFLRNYVAQLVPRLPRPTFEGLLGELELAAMRRDLLGVEASPIERVDREWQVVTYHDPRHGRRQVTFKTVRNIARLRNPEIR